LKNLLEDMADSSDYGRLIKGLKAKIDEESRSLVRDLS